MTTPGDNNASKKRKQDDCSSSSSSKKSKPDDATPQSKSKSDSKDAKSMDCSADNKNGKKDEQESKHKKAVQALQVKLNEAIEKNKDDWVPVAFAANCWKFFLVHKQNKEKCKCLVCGEEITRKV
jgi:hypothetical protein